MKNNIFSFFLACNIFAITLCAPQKAVICVPIADLVGYPLAASQPQKSITDIYNSIPVSGENINGYLGCIRLHQLLYNDVVDVIKMTPDEVCISINHAFYTTHASLVPQKKYWTLNSNIKTFEELSE